MDPVGDLDVKSLMKVIRAETSQLMTEICNYFDNNWIVLCNFSSKNAKNYIIWFQLLQCEDSDSWVSPSAFLFAWFCEICDFSVFSAIL